MTYNWRSRVPDGPASGERPNASCACVAYEGGIENTPGGWSTNQASKQRRPTTVLFRLPLVTFRSQNGGTLSSDGVTPLPAVAANWADSRTATVATSSVASLDPGDDLTLLRRIQEGNKEAA